MNADAIQTILIYALPVLLSITVHEAAHGYAARHFGDRTAEMMGRITLNPLKHIDPIGTIVMPLFLYFATSGAFLFGYAKPVPVNFGALRNPKRDMVWVALAGPASNLAQAIGWALLLVVYATLGVTEPFFVKMAQGGILANLVMWAFNLFPLPPLDGARLAFLGYELVTRRRANPKVEATVFMIGVLILIPVLIMVTVGDCRRMF